MKSNKKKTMIWTIVAILLVVGIILFFILGNDSIENQPSGTPSETNAESNPSYSQLDSDKDVFDSIDEAISLLG